jgi:long-chain acyl-CoA synthetase
MIRAMNLARLGEENVERFGPYVSLAFEDREYTNVEQQGAANRLAHALTRLGVAEGDRVVVMLPNCPEVLQSYAAILKTGAVVVPVVFLLSPEEVRHILADSEAKVVITSEALAAKVEDWPGTVIMVGGGGSGLAYDDLVAAESDRFATRERGDADLAVILYTAGTTGRPKGVALSHGNLAANARASASLYELDVAKSGATLHTKSVIAFCEERLARYKCPREVRLVEALPKSPIGKILRKELRARVQ